MAPERPWANRAHLPAPRVLRAVPFGRWRAEEKGKGKKKIPSVREGWRGERGLCQVQAGRSDQGDASQFGPRRPASRRRRAQGGEQRSPRSRRDPGQAAAALCCIAAAHKGGGPGLRASRPAGGLHHELRVAFSQPGPPPPPPPRVYKEAIKRRTWPRRLQRRLLPARAAGSSLARRPRQHNRRAGAVQGSCATPRRLAGVVVRARVRARAAQGRPRRTDYMSRPRRRHAVPRPARPRPPAPPTWPPEGPAKGRVGAGLGGCPPGLEATLEPWPALAPSLLAFSATCRE